MDNETEYNFSNIKLRELSIKLERFQPEDIGKYLKQQSSYESQDQVKIEAADVMVKEEPREEAVSVEELLSDEELEEENSAVAVAPARKVFECGQWRVNLFVCVRNSVVCVRNSEWGCLFNF